MVSSNINTYKYIILSSTHMSDEERAGQTKQQRSSNGQQQPNDKTSNTATQKLANFLQGAKVIEIHALL